MSEQIRSCHTLKQQLAEALGWFGAYVDNHEGVDDMTGASVVYMCEPDGTMTNHYIIADDEYPDWHENPEAELWDCYAIPDWEHDTGAALALCLEIALERGWGIDLVPYNNGTLIAAFLVAKDDRDVMHAAGSTPAEALARLALDALST